jgi:MGT family glycosyltransferase
LDWGGFLRTAQVLQSRGHQVIWLSEPPIRPLVDAAGLPFQAIPVTGWLWPPPPPPDLTNILPQEAVFLRYRRALDTWLTEELIYQGVDSILALAESTGKPDVILTDPFLVAAALAAEKLNVKLGVVGWPAGQPLDENQMFAVQQDLSRISKERIKRLTDHYGLEGVNFSGGAAPAVQSPDLHLSFFSREWHQADPDFLPQTRFMGGIAQPYSGDPSAWLADIPAKMRCALITLGSTFTGDLGFFGWAAQAAARLRLTPIVVIGTTPLPPEQKEQLKASLPPGTRLLAWIKYDEVFPRLSVIIHHGGMATTHSAILAGIPQVVVPHAADQRGQARRAAQAKVGLNLTAHDVKTGQLLPAIRAVVTDPNVSANVAGLKEAFAKLGGVSQAATEVEKILLGLPALG